MDNPPCIDDFPIKASIFCGEFQNRHVSLMKKYEKNPIKNNIKQPWRQDAYVLPAIRQPTVAQPRRATFRSQALAFKHLDVEVTAVKVAFFREALIEAAESRDGCFGTKKREGCPDII